MTKEGYSICWLKEGTKKRLTKFKANNENKTYSEAVDELINIKQDNKKNEKMFPKW